MPEITQADRDDSQVMPVETMTAMEMSTTLLEGLMALGDPVGVNPRPVIGRYQMLKSSEIIDLVRRKHIIPCHRSYIARIIELLATTTAAAEAAKAEATRAERERWEKACSLTLCEAQERIDDLKQYGTDKAYEEGVCFGVRRVWDWATDGPSAPTPLTADAVKRMLPANGDGGYGGESATYSSWIRWSYRKDGSFALEVNGRETPLESIGTVPAFAKLIEALGVTVEVGRGE